MQRKVFAFLLVLGMFAFPAGAQELLTLPLDNAAQISPLIMVDPAEKVQGEASVKIETKWPTVVCLGQLDGLDLDNARLVYQAKVKSRLQGSAYLEMWVEVAGRGYFARGINDQIKGDDGWKDIKTIFLLQEGQKAAKVTLNLVINGIGQVWIDEARLRKSPLK